MKRAQGTEWAERRVETYQCGVCHGKVHAEACADLLRKEHARAVRVVQKAERMELRKVLDTDTNEYLAGYQQATSDILTALQRGRGWKG